MRRKRRPQSDRLRPSLEEAVSTLRRTGRPVLVRRNGEVVGALVSLEDLRQHLGSPSEVSLPDPSPVRPTASPTRTLEALRELHDLGAASD